MKSISDFHNVDVLLMKIHMKDILIIEMKDHYSYSEHGRKIKISLSLFVKIGISIFLLILLFRKLNIGIFLKELTQIHPGIILGSFLIYGISIAIGALKWKQFLNNISFGILLNVCFKAQFYSTIFPGQLFGEASKVVTLYTGNKDTAKITVSVIADKLTGLISTILIGLIGFFMSSIVLPCYIIWSLVISCIVFIIFFFIPRISIVDKVIIAMISKNSYLDRIILKRILNTLGRLYGGWKTYVFQNRMLLRALLLGCMNQIVGVTQIYFIARTLRIAVPFYEYMWIISALSFILLLPVSFGGLGLREISLVGFLELFAISNEKSFMISVIILSSQIFSACVGGILVLLGWRGRQY